MRRWNAVIGLVALAGIVSCSDGDPPSADPAATSAPAAPPETSATASLSTVATSTPATDIAGPATTGDDSGSATSEAAATPPETAASDTAAATTSPPATADALDRYPDQPPGVPFPRDDWPLGELSADVDRAAIDRAVDDAFGAPDATSRLRSVVAVQGGEIVYERYHPLDGPDVVNDSFSVAKSVTSALIGLLVADGRLSLDDHPPRPEWPAGDPRTEITLRDLLQMSSGLTWAEEYAPGSMPIEMITAHDAAHYVADQPLEADPGTLFDYSTGTTALLVGIAADELGGCEAASTYLEERLLDPLDITSAEFMRDGRGCWLGGLGANMTTRDFARFGLLYLRGGEWDGAQILPTEWIDETRVPAASQPGYGLQWWLSADGRTFNAEGLFGQRIAVVPDADLVVALNTTMGGDSGTPTAVILGELAPPPAD